MKSIIMAFALLAVLNGCATTTPRRAAPQQVRPSADFQIFYDELSPYGTWVEYPNYGYVWMPDAGPGFSPYATDGHWIFTDDGWTWVSDYQWGWAPFHYGRWDYDNYYGWFWVPDNQWGPAWVSWRRSPGYYGWAPLRPGVPINMALGRDYRERNERWVFVREWDMARPDIGVYYIDRSNNVTIINNSTVIVNTRRDDRRNAVYITGPDRGEIERATRTRIEPYVIRENDRPGHRLTNGELDIYRPQVQSRTRGGQNPAPSRVMRLNEVRPPSERSGGIRQRDNNPSGSAPQERPNGNPPGRTRTQQPQPPVVVPQGTTQQPPNGNPPGRTRTQQPQPPVVVPQGTTQQPPNGNPPDRVRRDRQPNVKPSESTQQPKPTPPGRVRREQQQPPDAAPPAKEKPVRQRGIRQTQPPPPKVPEVKEEQKERRKREE